MSPPEEVGGLDGESALSLVTYMTWAPEFHLRTSV